MTQKNLVVAIRGLVNPANWPPSGPGPIVVFEGASDPFHLHSKQLKTKALSHFMSYSKLCWVISSRGGIGQKLCNIPKTQRRCVSDHVGMLTRQLDS